jgi:hypothetical protein
MNLRVYFPENICGLLFNSLQVVSVSSFAVGDALTLFLKTFVSKPDAPLFSTSSQACSICVVVNLL